MLAAADDRTLLAPSAELAAALFAAIETAHLAAGHTLWPTPRVRDLSGWLREGHALRRLEDARLPRLLGDADERELWRAVIDASPLARDLVDPAGAVRAARRARRTAIEHSIPSDALARHALGSEEAQAFIDWNREFDVRCRALDCIDATELLRGWLVDGAAAGAARLAWIDNPAWRPAARRRLQRGGAPLPPPPSAAACAASRLHARSQAEELATMAQWAGERLRRDPQFRAWMCVPGLEHRRAAVIDAFDAVLAPARYLLAEDAGGAAYAVAGGVPLAELTPVRPALECLEAMLGPVPFERFSALLRQPELQASRAEAAAAARLDLELRASGPAEADLGHWLELAERRATLRQLKIPNAVPRLRTMRRELDKATGRRALSQWIRHWVSALEQGPWMDRARWSSAEFQAAQRLRELLGELAMADAIFGLRSGRGALALLRRAAQDTPFQPQTGVPAILISGQLVDPWLPQDGLWVAGCDEQRWPPRIDPVPLLPVSLQRQHGVVAASPEAQLRFAADLQRRWQERAAESCFSYADPGEGRAAAPSPLLPRETSSVPTVTARPHWRAQLAAAPACERFLDEQAPLFGAGERTRGVATLRSQSRCAFRGFAEHRLRCESLERPVPGFNERERGELTHWSLEHVWSVLRGSGALNALEPAAQAALLHEAAAGAIERVARRRDPGARWRQRELERLQLVLARWLDVERQRQAFTVEKIEDDARTVRLGGLEFTVRLDRMDRLADGSTVLIDYKTGSAFADWRGERPDNPQLPLYALVHPESLVAVAYGKVNAADLAFVPESERPDVFAGRRRTRLEGEPDMASLVRLWSARLETLAENFARGRAEVAPTASACRSCSLQALCRVPSLLDVHD